MKCCMLNLETHTGILYYRFNVTKKNATDIITVQGLNYLHIWISTSVLQEHTAAVLMRCATIQRDCTTVNVNLDILGTD